MEQIYIELLNDYPIYRQSSIQARDTQWNPPVYTIPKGTKFLVTLKHWMDAIPRNTYLYDLIYNNKNHAITSNNFKVCKDEYITAEFTQTYKYFSPNEERIFNKGSKYKAFKCNWINVVSHIWIESNNKFYHIPVQYFRPNSSCIPDPFNETAVIEVYNPNKIGVDLDIDSETVDIKVIDDINCISIKNNEIYTISRKAWDRSLVFVKIIPKNGDYPMGMNYTKKRFQLIPKTDSDKNGWKLTGTQSGRIFSGNNIGASIKDIIEFQDSIKKNMIEYTGIPTIFEGNIFPIDSIKEQQSKDRENRENKALKFAENYGMITPMPSSLAFISSAQTIGKSNQLQTIWDAVFPRIRNKDSSITNNITIPKTKKEKQIIVYTMKNIKL